MSSFIKSNVRQQHFSLTEENAVSCLCQPARESTRFVACHFCNGVCYKLLLLVFRGHLREQHQQNSTAACDSLAALWFFHAFIHSFIHSSIHAVFCLTTGPQVCDLVFLLSFSSILFFFLSVIQQLLSLLLPRLPVTPILQPIFPSMTRFRRQFLRKMGPIDLVFLPCILGRIFLYCLTLCSKS